MATTEKYQTTSGATLYAVRYRKPDHGTTRKRGFRTKRDAEAFAATVEGQSDGAPYVAPSVGRITVSELGPAWPTTARPHETVRMAVLCERVAYPYRAAVGQHPNRRSAPYRHTGVGRRVGRGGAGR